LVCGHTLVCADLSALWFAGHTLVCADLSALWFAATPWCALTCQRFGLRPHRLPLFLPNLKTKRQQVAALQRKFFFLLFFIEQVDTSRS